MLVISKSIKMPERCGKGCYFCEYREEDDLYHCIFFKDKNNTEIINLCSEEKVKHLDCPLIEDWQLVKFRN